MNCEKVTLTGAQETVPAALYRRTLDSRSPRSDQYNDEAARALRRIDHAFRETVVKGTSAVGVTLRARQLDHRNRDFLAAQPSATVLHLACRLDTRVHRIAPSPPVRWLDVDFPEVLDLRRHLLREPEDVDYRTGGSSVTADGWLELILADRPTVAVFEGLAMYLRTEEGRRLVQGDTRRFPGGRLLFDVYGTIGIRLQKRVSAVRDAGATLHRGVDDQKELESWAPGLTLLDSVRSVDVPRLDPSTRRPGGAGPLARTVRRDQARSRTGWSRTPARSRSGRPGTQARWRTSRSSTRSRGSNAAMAGGA